MIPIIGGRGTLRWQLVWRLAAMLGALMFAVSVALVVILMLFMPEAQQADYNLRPLISRSIAERDGHLVVKPEAIKELKDSAPGLWFIAVAPDGRRVVFNQIPVAYESFIENFANVRYMDVRGPDGSSWTAITAEMDTDAGKLTILYGGKAMPNPEFFSLLWDLMPVYFPLVLAPMLIVLIAVPLVIGRALKGVEKTTSRASEIDATRLGERLPKDGVVKELHPLVDGMNAALERIDEGVGRSQRFLTNAAHELRTPVAILHTRIETMDDSAHREKLLLDVTRLGAMAEHLLDFERFGTDGLRERLDLVEMCETVAADLAPLAIAAGYELNFEPRLRTHVVQADAQSLERALTNLIMNAIQHGNGQGSILIEVTAEGHVEISDEGPGVPPDQRERVFEPFHRVRPSSTGAGLGLSLVRQIANAHGGNVQFLDSAKGARIRFAVGST